MPKKVVAKTTKSKTLEFLVETEFLSLAEPGRSMTTRAVFKTLAGIGRYVSRLRLHYQGYGQEVIIRVSTKFVV